MFLKKMEILSTNFFTWMCVSVIKMFQYEKINVSEAIDVDRKNASKECMLCHYWYFKDVGFKFEPHVCNKCHEYKMQNE